MKSVNLNWGWFIVVSIIIAFILLSLLVFLHVEASPSALSAPRGSIIVLQADGTPLEPIPLPDAGNILLTDVLNIIASYGAVVGAAVTIVVGLLKYLPFFNNPDNISGALLNTLVSAIAVIGYWAAVQFGLLTQYQQGLKIIENVGQLLLALLSSIIGSSLMHKQSVKGDIPIAGYQRTPSLKP